jgi:hypothetical protein
VRVAEGVLLDALDTQNTAACLSPQSQTRKGGIPSTTGWAIVFRQSFCSCASPSDRTCSKTHLTAAWRRKLIHISQIYASADNGGVHTNPVLLRPKFQELEGRDGMYGWPLIIEALRLDCTSGLLQRRHIRTVYLPFMANLSANLQPLRPKPSPAAPLLSRPTIVHRTHSNLKAMRNSRNNKLKGSQSLRPSRGWSSTKSSCSCSPVAKTPQSRHRTWRNVLTCSSRLVSHFSHTARGAR